MTKRAVFIGLSLGTLLLVAVACIGCGSARQNERMAEVTRQVRTVAGYGTMTPLEVLSPDRVDMWRVAKKPDGEADMQLLPEVHGTWMVRLTRDGDGAKRTVFYSALTELEARLAIERCAFSNSRVFLSAWKGEGDGQRTYFITGCK